MMQTVAQGTYLRFPNAKDFDATRFETNTTESEVEEMMLIQPSIMDLAVRETKVVESTMTDSQIMDSASEIQMPIIKITSFGHLKNRIPSADVILVCGEREFPAHRLVLSGNSLYFQSIFQSNRENNDGETVVVPEPVTDEVLEDILEYLYSGELQDKEDEKASLRTVLAASQILKMNELFAYTLNRLAEYLSANDLQEFFHLVTEYEHTTWITQIVTHIINKFCDIHSRSDFYNMEVNEFNKILSHVKLEKGNMADFTSSLVTWLNCSQYRRDDIDNLSSICNFAHLASVLWPLFWNENDDNDKDQRFLEVMSMNVQNTTERTNTETKIRFSNEEEDEQHTSYDRFV